MARSLGTCALIGGSLAGLAGCAPREAEVGAATGDAALALGPADYLGGAVTLMGGDLVSVRTAMSKAATRDDILDYSRCVAAGFATGNNAGFLRNVRAKTAKRGGIWHADIVYSITSALPDGLQTIDAEVTVADCTERGIPVGE
ncbi:MAG: hypothetical protein WBA91_07990 [Paracoccaceae bacterium]